MFKMQPAEMLYVWCESNFLLLLNKEIYMTQKHWDKLPCGMFAYMGRFYMKLQSQRIIEQYIGENLMVDDKGIVQDWSVLPKAGVYDHE
jgi:hypothetical protein